MFNFNLTPEAFFMLPLAIGLDLTGVILFCFGLDDFGLTDMLGIGFINGWLLLRGKQVGDMKSQGRKGAIGKLKNIFTDKNTKFIVPAFGELIPYFGVLPFWTISVILNLTEE